MRYAEAFIPTLRDVAADVEMPSHRLLLRAGFIRQLAAGVYSYLPLGWRVLHRVMAVIRAEMDRAGAQELLLPALHPRELWTESGREATMQDILLGVTDRREAEYYLGPTHEEVITALVRDNVRSYRELPLNLYQIQTKFRDEPRPRGGLVRAREFIMKDAYSFSRDDDSLDVVYRQMYGTYITIFQRVDLDIVPVDASGGAIGGKETKEFMLITETGEDSILLCPQCGYAANMEIADFRLVVPTPAEPPQPMAKVHTPDAHTVDEVCAFLKTTPNRLVKTLILMADGTPVAALVRGNRDLNEARFRTLLGATHLEMATPEQIQDATGGPLGFSGPVGLSIPIYADEELRGLVNFVTGANENDHHLVNVNWTDVASPVTWLSLRYAVAGDLCARCGETFDVRRGMELAHIFKLRTAISAALNATFTDEDGQEKPFVMGCYGIGVSRILAAVAEIHHDEYGLIWPMSIAPFQVHLIVTNPAEPVQTGVADDLYARLQHAGIDVLYDDRSERAGVKFNDADLIGIPIRLVAGKLAAEGKVEIRSRRTKEVQTIATDVAVSVVTELIEQARSNEDVE